METETTTAAVAVLQSHITDVKMNVICQNNIFPLKVHQQIQDLMVVDLLLWLLGSRSSVKYTTLIIQLDDIKLTEF